jgi:hypothetical protein
MSPDLAISVSEATAEAGSVLVSGPHRDYVLSDAVAWREGDTYIIRSSEFDAMAESSSFPEALDILICRLLDYTSLLHEQVASGSATPGEVEDFSTLATRFFPLVEAMQRDSERRRRRLWPPRRRGSGSGHWQHRGTQAGASAQLSAT